MKDDDTFTFLYLCNDEHENDGKDGRVDIFGSIELSEDGTYLIITLADGSETFTIPIMT